MIIFIIIIFILIAGFLIYRRLTSGLPEDAFWPPFVAIIVAIGIMIQANIKYTAVVKIENKIRNISETMAELISVNQAWSGARLSELEGVIDRMEKARMKINLFLDVVGTLPEKRKIILKELENMIEHDRKQLESKKK